MRCRRVPRGFILLGAAALERWRWVSFIFGALLLYAAWKAWGNNPTKHERSPVLRWLSRRLPVKENAPNGQFIAEKDGARAVTPLLLALFAIEVSDILFAIDSVPAALSITHDRFVVYSSNIFAILGLRALFLLMAQTIPTLRYLHYDLAAVLGFAAFKMMASDWVDIPPLMSVGAIVFALSVAILASLRARRTWNGAGA